jgi:hypothetical protein
MRSLVSVLAVGLLVVALVLLLAAAQTRKRDGASSQRRRVASARGWTYVDPAQNALFRLEGSIEGLPWRCEAYRPLPGDPSRRGAPHHTALTVTIPGDGVVIVPRVEGGVSRAVALALLRATPRGEPAARIAEHGAPHALDDSLEARVTDPTRWQAVGHELAASVARINAVARPTMVVWAADELTVFVGEVIEDEERLARWIDSALQLVARVSASRSQRSEAR